MEFTKSELEMLYLALVEYENSHYMSQDVNWQGKINTLISKVYEVM